MPKVMELQAPNPEKSREERIADAKKHFVDFYGKIPAGQFVYLTTFSGGTKCYTFDSADESQLQAMAEKAIELSDSGVDVYHSVNSVSVKPTDNERGKETVVSYQTAVVVDIDIQSDAHKSDNLAADFDEAKSFLPPFKPSKLFNSGYGLHAYYLFDKPLEVTADNRAECKRRNNRLLEFVRQRANGKKIDAVGDLTRVLRTPGTFNKRGKDNPPLCHVVEDNNIRYTPAEIDALLPAKETSTRQQSPDLKKSARQIQSRNTTDTPEYTAFRIRRMLDFISVAKGDYNKWIDVGFALFNEGMQLSDWEQWSRKQPEFKEGECASKWKGFRYDPTGISVKSLYRWAEKGGYSESETRQEYNREIFKGDSSDISFSRRFERIFGKRVRWLGDSERWLIYKSGVWTRGTESNSCVLPFAMDAERLLSRTANNEFAKDLARKITSAKKISAAITLMKGIESIRITQDDLNRHNELLNVQNGVVDLSNGKLYPHAPELLITQQCRADYDPNANSPLVDKFFCDIQPNEQTRAGLLRWLGYCLTGESSEEKFMVWYGTGANGKGVLSKTLLYLLGNYGAGLAPRALLRSNRAVDANAATTALNAIEDARFAISEELPADAELDASLVKNLTGGDKINLRRNFGEYRAIENRAKINISGNYLPKIENTADNGLLRRMLSMPFNMRFVKPIATADPQLKTKMIEPKNLRRLLSLLIREAVAWYNNGLIVSDQMEETTQKLLGQSDFVAQFIEDFYTIDPNGEVNAKTFLDELKSSYPVECHRLRRVDLIKLIAHNSAITYTKGKNNANVFKGLSKKYFT